jgi:peptidoglycan/LPS O-acetylase OafA/YrhL
MFFVLSGFVLSRPYLTSARTGQTPRQLFVPTFYLRRIARIWIPWFCVFIVSAMLRTYLYHLYDTVPPISEWIREFWHFPLTLSHFLGQCAFVYHTGQKQLLPQDWSLGVELIGSALIPVFVFLARKHSLYLIGAGVLLLVCVPIGTDPYYISSVSGMFAARYYFSFVLGVLAARYYDAIELSMRRFTFAAKCGILAFGILLYQSRLMASHLLGGGEVTAIEDHILWCICSVGCVLIITATMGSNHIQKVMSHGVLVFLGRISYSVYLLQFVVLLCVLPPLIHGLNLIGIQQILVLMLLSIGIGVLVTVMCAAFTYRIVEVPSIEFGRWISTFIQRRFPKDTS